MRAIAVTGGKGGVGKTSFSTALAMALAEKGARTILFDADLALANVDVVLGIQSEWNLQHVLNDEKTLREIVHPGPGGIQVITGASGVSTLVNAGPKRLKKFFSQLYALESDADTIIFDTGSGIDRKVMSFLKVADEVVVVVTPDAASMTDGYATIKQLVKTHKGSKICVVVNMVDSEREAQKAFDALQAISEKFLKAELTYVGCIRADTTAAKCIRRRIPFFVQEPDCKASTDIRAIAENMAGFTHTNEISFAERVQLAFAPARQRAA